MTDKEKLEAYEKMQHGITETYNQISQQMEKLKEQGKVKSATSRQLMGKKMTYSAFLGLYKVYGLEE